MNLRLQSVNLMNNDTEPFTFIEEFKSTKQEFHLMGLLCKFSVQLLVLLMLIIDSFPV